MPNPSWPAGLPQRWGGGAQRQPAGNVLRTEMDVGPPKMRRRATADFIPTSFSILLTTAEKDTLDTFYLTTLTKVLPFDWKDFSTASEPTRTFRFVKEPAYQHAGGGLWMAHLELEQMP